MIGQVNWILFSFHGRLARKWYWLGYSLALLYLLFVPTLILLSIFGLKTSGSWVEVWTFAVAILPGVWMGGAVGAKRLHDRGKSGWWMLLFGIGPFLSTGTAYVLAELIIPRYGLAEAYETIYSAAVTILLIVGGVLFWGSLIELGFAKGTEGPNRYGLAPGS
jgi:uncharacterized membrane protein YhaH (DUF805 family)